jgi:hypothetical protein
MALWMRLLYWRKYPYYIQHLVFLVHWHTFLLVLLTLLGLVLWTAFVPLSAVLVGRNIVAGGGLLYAFLSLRNVYQQSWGKTTAKFLLFILGYIVVLGIALMLFLGLNFLLL